MYFTTAHFNSSTGLVHCGSSHLGQPPTKTWPTDCSAATCIVVSSSSGPSKQSQQYTVQSYCSIAVVEDMYSQYTKVQLYEYTPQTRKPKGNASDFTLVRYCQCAETSSGAPLCGVCRWRVRARIHRAFWPVANKKSRGLLCYCGMV